MGKSIQYELEFRPSAVRDFDELPRQISRRIIGKIERMQNGLAGDVKRLTDHTPEYRLRVGDYRVLFTLESHRIIVYRILHRREAYGG